MVVKRKWKASPFPWVLCFWTPGEWSLQTQHTRAQGTAPVSLLSPPHGLLPQAHLKSSVLLFILSSFRALVQCPVLLQRTPKMQISIVKKKGKPENMWSVWFISVISELSDTIFKLSDAIFPSLCSGDLSQDDIYTQYLDVEINPKNTTKVEFRWNKAIFSLLWARLGAETVNIIHGADGHRWVYPI